jgi:uncharacterized repeat protein (TIGR03843 family)
MATAGADGPDDVLTVEAVVEVLARGALSVEGRLVGASNATLYCRVALDGIEAACVYKPIAGERPLWDFPDGTLAHREVAAYEVSQAGGWQVVPPTVFREGPFGPGMVQWWIEVDDEVDLVHHVRSHDERLRTVAVYDAVINNADRKGGHLLPDRDGGLWAIDHGVAFSEDDKLRTVLWGWAGDRIPDDDLDRVRAVDDAMDDPSSDLARALSDLLSPRERRATRRRVRSLLRSGRHPEPGGDWPPVPWPPF